MKLFNIFKKESSNNSKFQSATVQKMDKSQLEKIVGGDGEDALREKLKATTGSTGNFLK